MEGRCGIASNLGKTRVIGVEAGPPPPGMSWARMCGEATSLLGSPAGHRCSCRHGPRKGCVRSSSSSTSCPSCRICNAHGCYCGSAHPQGPTMPFGQCLLLSPRLMQARMMPRCGQHCRLSWEGPASKTTVLRGGGRAAGCLGGLGLQSAELTAPAAYWAAWADVLPRPFATAYLGARRIT